MGRIRTIKPEYPQSEPVGRLSREARLLDLLIKTVVDDEGRARGASRALASLLYPYDEDAPDLIEGWLKELERERRISRYVADGCTYLAVINFLEDERIDKPSKSKLPPPPNLREDSPNTREDSLRTKDQGRDRGSGGEQGAPANASRPLSPCPGANGEFILATALAQEIPLNARAGDIAVLARAIEIEAAEHRGDLLAAKNFIRDRAREARDRGEVVGTFWIQDQKHRAKPKLDKYETFLAEETRQ